MKINLFKKKRCPRCGTKVLKEVMRCPRCQLDYIKFDTATNTEAKQAIKMGEKERVIMRSGCPHDVSRATLILLTIFLGFMGAHYYYVGRNKKGIFYTIFFLIGMVNAVLTSYFNLSFSGDMYQIFQLLVVVWGVVLIMWIYDIIVVCFNRFKIPVSRSKHED